MTMYMQSTLELRGGDTTAFRETMKIVVETVEKAAGWRLITAIEQITGRLHTAIDVWELPDLDAYAKGLGALRGHPEFAAIGKSLADAIERETVVLGTRASWVPADR